MSYLHNISRNFTKVVGTVVILTVVSSCAATFRNHGYMPLAQDVALLKVGKDTRDTVAEAIGKPNSEGVLARNGYYYVRSRFKHYLYNAPKEIDREILAISFTDKGVVENIERFGLEDGRIVVLERRVTDSNIKGVGFFKQLFGSFGRIDLAEQFANR